MSEKETNCRNPILQKMFMRLGRAEKAGKPGKPPAPVGIAKKLARKTRKKTKNE